MFQTLLTMNRNTGITANVTLHDILDNIWSNRVSATLCFLNAFVFTSPT